MRTPLLCVQCFAGIICGVFLLGCAPQTYPVTGKVTIKNDTNIAKLAGYGVMFEMSEPGPNGKVESSLGELDAAGKFVLSTLGQNDGAYAGKYRVAITPPIPMGDDAFPPQVIDKRYYNLQTSGIEVTIEPKSNELTWELDPAGK